MVTVTGKALFCDRTPGQRRAESFFFTANRVPRKLCSNTAFCRLAISDASALGDSFPTISLHRSCDEAIRKRLRLRGVGSEFRYYPESNL